MWLGLAIGLLLCRGRNVSSVSHDTFGCGDKRGKRTMLWQRRNARYCLCACVGAYCAYVWVSANTPMQNEFLSRLAKLSWFFSLLTGRFKYCTATAHFKLYSDKHTNGEKNLPNSDTVLIKALEVLQQGTYEYVSLMKNRLHKLVASIFAQLWNAEE